MGYGAAAAVAAPWIVGRVATCIADRIIARAGSDEPFWVGPDDDLSRIGELRPKRNLPKRIDGTARNVERKRDLADVTRNEVGPR